MADLLINGADAYITYGVRMGDGFLDAIDALLSVKEYVENKSRNENGKRIITTGTKIDDREITLAFTITGKSESDFRAKKKAFEQILYSGNIEITIPALGSDVYRLVYLGKSIAYGLSLSRSFCKFSAKFSEPNPANRTPSTQDGDTQV